MKEQHALLAPAAGANRTSRAMRPMRFFSLAAALIGSSACSSKPTGAVAPDNATAMAIGSNEVRISVEGMSCSACAARLKRGLKATAGVVDVEVNLVERGARVRYLPEKTTPEKIAASINGLGFKAGSPPAIESRP